MYMIDSFVFLLQRNDRKEKPRKILEQKTNLNVLIYTHHNHTEIYIYIQLKASHTLQVEDKSFDKGKKKRKKFLLFNDIDSKKKPTS